MKQSLPGIKSIGYLPCHLLPPNILQKHLAGVAVGIYSIPTPVEHYGNAECTAEQEYDHGSYLERSTLTFTTTDRIPNHLPLAFVMTDVNGQSYVIGFHEAPLPVVEISQKTGETDCIFEVKVNFSARKSLISCVT